MGGHSGEAAVGGKAAGEQIWDSSRTAGPGSEGSSRGKRARAPVQLEPHKPEVPMVGSSCWQPRASREPGAWLWGRSWSLGGTGRPGSTLEEAGS